MPNDTCTGPGYPEYSRASKQHATKGRKDLRQRCQRLSVHQAILNLCLVTLVHGILGMHAYPEDVSGIQRFGAV